MSWFDNVAAEQIEKDIEGGKQNIADAKAGAKPRKELGKFADQLAANEVRVVLCCVVCL